MKMRPLFLFLTCSLLPIATAQAALPDATTSTSPALIYLVGYGAASGPDVTDGLFTVIVRTSGGAAIDGSRVTVSICEAGDLEIGQVQDPTYTVNCAAGTVSALTDPQGQVNFTILGASTGQFVGSSLRGTVKIFADDPVTHQNVLISDPSSLTGLVCATPDEDGRNGVTALDIDYQSHDLGAQWQRSDMNGDGVVDSTDLSILTNLLFAGRIFRSAQPFCTSCVTPTRSGTWGALKVLYR